MGRDLDPMLLQRIREGLREQRLSENNVALAVFLGSREASVALEELIEAPDELKPWCEAIYDGWGKSPTGRTIIAWARTAMLRWDKPPLPAKLRPRLNPLPYALLHAAEKLAIAPNETAMTSAIRLLEPAYEEPELLAEQDGLPDHASILSLTIQAAAIMTGASTTALHEARDDAYLLWPNNVPLIKRIAAIELIPWTLGEQDALTKRPTLMPTD